MRDDPTVVALVERARGGEQGAWDEIVRRYMPLVWSLCRRYRLSGGDVDDVAASVWLRLVERLDTIRDPAALPGWLATTARRECMQLIRTRERQVPTEQDLFPDEASEGADERLLAEERHIALRVAFAELPERCQELLTLLSADPPIPYIEIANRLGMAIGGIGPTRKRCLDRLRQQPSIAAIMGIAPTSGR